MKCGIEWMKPSDNHFINRQACLFNANFLNFAPFICSLMVIMIHQHTIAGHSLTVSSRVISFFTHGVCTAAVPTFFVISGFLFYRNTYTIRSVFQKQKKRLKTVLMPFLAWSAFYYMMYAIASLVVPGFLQSNVDLSPVGILKGVVFYEYAFPMWYMFQLCVYILLAPVLFVALKSKTASIVILVGTATLGITNMVDISVDLGTYERALFQFNFFTYYWVGCLLARWQNVGILLCKLAKRTPWVVLLMVLVAAGTLESLAFDDVISSISNRCAVPLVFAVFFLLMVKLSHRMRSCHAPKASTMVIYGVHSVVGIFLGKFVFSGWCLHPIVQFIVSFTAVAVCSVAVAWGMRYIKPIHCVFSGNR